MKEFGMRNGDRTLTVKDSAHNGRYAGSIPVGPISPNPLVPGSSPGGPI
jgi:hypothetical protein